MANSQAIAVQQYRTPPSAEFAGKVVVHEGEYDVTVAGAELGADGDTIDLCVLPAGHVPVDFLLAADDLDGATALVLDVGLRNADGAGTDDPDAFIDGSTVGQAGGIARAGVVAFADIAPADVDRFVYVTAVTAAGTDAAGKLRGKLLYTTPGYR